MTITNVHPEVFEILDMTGFTQIFAVEKAFRRITVEGLPVIGHGQTATIYRIDPDTIVKVFRPSVGIQMVRSEIAKIKVAFRLGIPAAISYDMVQVDDRFGVVYELLNARDLASCMWEAPDRREAYLRRFAQEIRQMHTAQVSPEEFVSARATSLGALPYARGRLFTEEEYGKVKAVLENVPECNTFVHGDCHTGNVMVQDGELMFIDFSCAGCGHPIFDLMSMYLTAVCGQGEQFKGYTPEEACHLWRVFLSAYLQTEDAAFLDKVEEQVAAFSCARVLLGLLRIPDMLKPETIAAFKAKVCAWYDKGVEPLCF